MTQFKPSFKPVALITGGASFLGKAIAFKLVKNGFEVVLHYQNSLEKVRKLSGELRNFGGEVAIVKSDLRRTEQADMLIKKAVKLHRRLDLLINNASLFYPTPLKGGKPSQWREIFSINLFTPYFLARAAFPWLKKNRGCIINLSDIYGENPHLKDYSAYCVSKAGINSMSKVLARELGPEVRVNSVSPGAIFMPSTYSAKQKKELIDRSALRRQGKPEDIAEAVYFLATNQFVTGQNLKVDGGRYL